MKRILITFIISAIALLGEDIYATFDVKAHKQANLTPNVGGIIKEIFVEVGESVAKGEKLVSLDNDKQALALKLAKNTLEKSKLDYEHAKKTYNRYAKIRDVIDKERFDNFEFTMNVKEQDFLKAKNNYELAKVKYEDTYIIAPFAGKISDKFLDAGNSVDTKNPVVQIVDTSSVKLILKFDEKHWKSVEKGQNFTYRVDGDSSEYQGKISKVYPVVNPKNRKIKAEVITQDIIPGLFGDGYIEAK